jgi:hypothetical protein
MNIRKTKQLLTRSRYELEGVGHKEMVKEGKYDGSILYSFMKMEQ